MIAALFVETGGCYFGLPDVDPWDKERDARRYDGPHPVVAHPPCERWHQLSAVNNKRWGFRINEDSGCFAAALRAVRRFGGVLEHPSESQAFKFHRIPEPVAEGWQRTVDGDWICEVWQSAFGHRARKRSWLLFHGPSAPPPLIWRRSPGSWERRCRASLGKLAPANGTAPRRGVRRVSGEVAGLALAAGRAAANRGGCAGPADVGERGKRGSVPFVRCASHGDNHAGDAAKWRGTKAAMRLPKTATALP